MKIMQILSAKPVIEKRSKELKRRIEKIQNALSRPPHLVVILVGEDPASQVYVNKKAKEAVRMGMTSETLRFPEHTDPSDVFHQVQNLNASDLVDGILIQRPLPKQFDEKQVVFWIEPSKDVDCLHPENVGLLVGGDLRFSPCTPAGVIHLLDFYEIPIAGKIACVIGRSSIVGKPLAALLLNKNATVIQIHRSTQNPKSLCLQADLVFAAAGSRQLVDKSWIKPGAVVIDVGIHRQDDGTLVGDVDSFSAGIVASALSPVPGGVGPMTIQTLLENTVLSAENRL
jgi:methylenetetrahydrofolate dehydrogenase (NADP+)/methenyltetrahydrofolate cyclohydrolase